MFVVWMLLMDWDRHHSHYIKRFPKSRVFVRKYVVVKIYLSTALFTLFTLLCSFRYICIYNIHFVGSILLGTNRFLVIASMLRRLVLSEVVNNRCFIVWYSDMTYYRWLFLFYACTCWINSSIILWHIFFHCSNKILPPNPQVD